MAGRLSVANLGSGKSEVEKGSPTIGLLANNVGVTTANTRNLGERVHDLFLTPNVGVCEVMVSLRCSSKGGLSVAPPSSRGRRRQSARWGS